MKKNEKIFYIIIIVILIILIASTWYLAYVNNKRFLLMEKKLTEVIKPVNNEVTIEKSAVEEESIKVNEEVFKYIGQTKEQLSSKFGNVESKIEDNAILIKFINSDIIFGFSAFSQGNSYSSDIRDIDKCTLLQVKLKDLILNSKEEKGITKTEFEKLFSDFSAGESAIYDNTDGYNMKYSKYTVYFDAPSKSDSVPLTQSVFIAETNQ